MLNGVKPINVLQAKLTVLTRTFSVYTFVVKTGLFTNPNAHTCKCMMITILFILRVNIYQTNASEISIHSRHLSSCKYIFSVLQNSNQGTSPSA